jgi:MtrB/PioB family decaheme-associated outer membrane protein
MTTMNTRFVQKALALAITAAFGPVAFAEDNPEVAEFTQPSSSVSVGLGAVSGDSKDRSIFGQYNGMRKDSAYGLFDLDLVKRDDATGTWMILKGSNLGLDNRELSGTYEKQGDWKVTGSYNELTHREIRTINTADTGVGSTGPNVVALAVPGTGSTIDLKLKRTAYGIGGEKWITPSLMFEVNFKSEDKDGARFTGKGYDCATYVCTGSTATQIKNVTLMQAEPVNFNTKQIDMRLSYLGENLHMNAGYYGSLFDNSNGSVNMTAPNQLYGSLGTLATLYPAAAGGTSLQNVLQLPFALPPDNQAHQFYVDGNYGFTKTTKATFKYAYTHATQNESFGSMGLSGAPGNVGSLNGEVNTTLVQFGITSKPIPKLSVAANVRYEDKDDKTPKNLYNIENTTTWYNGLTSGSKLSGKLEASYQLPVNFRATLGADYNKIKREVPSSAAIDLVAGMSALRAESEETGYRAELSRMMSETLTGSISYTSSHRRGSDWTSLSTTTTASLLNTYCGGVTCYGQRLPASSILGLSATSVFPMSMADLNRDKWKISANWNPLERLSLQFVAEDGKDKNVTQADSIAGGKGYRRNGSNLYGIDAAYTISDKWQLTGYLSHGEQTLAVNHSTGYMLDLNDKSDAVGLGLKGQVSGRIELGAGFSYIKDTTSFGLSAAGSATGAAPTAANLQQAAIGLPSVDFSQATLSLYGKYSLDKKSDILVDLIHQRAKLKEWSWGNNGVPFVYADNTTVNLQQNQSVSYLGARYIYKFK